jgi:rod shape-determining protein MreC
MKKIKIKPRRSPKVIALTALCIFILLIILTSFFNVLRFAFTRFSDSFFYPYLRISSPSDRLSDTGLLLQDKSELATQVEKLTAVNRELTLQNRSAEELLGENEQLRRMLKLQKTLPVETITAEILLRDPLNFRDGFTISKGSRDGIITGSAVVDISPEGKMLLVGVIAETGARTSKVITVVNKSLRISGRVSSNKEIGFTNTGNILPAGGRIAFGMLPVRDDYIHGNMVTTTGFEAGILSGIKIGELHTARAIRAYDQEDYNCELQPAVKFENLRFVAVVPGYGNAAE